MDSERPQPPSSQPPSRPPAASAGAALFRQWLERTREQLKAADPVLKKKAGIAGTWLVLSLAALTIALTPYCGDGVKEMDARLRIQQVARLNQNITAFYLENTGRALWDKVELTLNDSYQLLMPSVAPGQNMVAQLDRFKKNDDSNEWVPDELPLSTLRLRCTAGEITFDLRTGQPIAP